MSQTQATQEAAEPAAPAAPPAAGSTLTAEEIALRVEAVLMTTDRALPPAKLAELVGDAGSKAVNAAVAALNEIYEKTGRSFRVESLAGGWQIMTQPRFAGVLAALHKTRQDTRLTPAALEALAIIAYKQPILRADVESIRGVASGEVIRGLMERHLVKITGRAEELGRPMLYGTTRTFLEVFGLSSLKDLPPTDEFKPAASAS
jgi:segregation and condensation protein B